MSMRDSYLGSMLIPASLAPRSVSSSPSSRAPRLCSSWTAFRRDSSAGGSMACACRTGTTVTKQAVDHKMTEAYRNNKALECVTCEGREKR